MLKLLELVPVESIGVESIGVVGVVGVRTPKKSAHNTIFFDQKFILTEILCDQKFS